MVERKDVSIFESRQNPPVTKQVTNLDVLTKINDPTKLLLMPQSLIRNPNDLYVTVVHRNKSVNPIFNVSRLDHF